MSGGLDSSYAAYVAKEKMGLRPLLFHVDAGWNTDQAVGNIEKLVDGLGLDLYTEVINWEEMKRLQVAFLRVAEFRIRIWCRMRPFFLGSINLLASTASSTSSQDQISRLSAAGSPRSGAAIWVSTSSCSAISGAKCGDGKSIETFPLVDILVYKVLYQKMMGMTVHYPLNLVPYVKKEAEDELERRFGWQRFQHKHHESRFTRFYEDYWLPRKFRLPQAPGPFFQPDHDRADDPRRSAGSDFPAGNG